MTKRAPLIGSAALACLLALTGCGGSEGAAADYGVKDRAITVEPGKRFSLTVPASPGLGEHWYLTDPKPDADVVKYRGEREDWKGGSDADGGTQGTQSFDFTAVAKGKAAVRLLYCPANTCHGPTDTASPYPTGTAASSPTPDGTVSPSLSPYPTATGAPGAQAGFYVFTITVR
ncbi:protease inhibitor I42 family protein [Streptomyces sp. NPDC006314]|uniref:protease inhibitor I42 family protein n=1 Tax=Streptomyces sp. NPDC006314 TaxID=3154475 RepID=UPI0033B15EAC